MSFKYLNKMPSPEEIIDMLPIDEQSRRIKEERAHIRQILTGESDKFVVMYDACSAHQIMRFMIMLVIGELQEKVADRLV